MLNFKITEHDKHTFLIGKITVQHVHTAGYQGHAYMEALDDLIANFYSRNLTTIPVSITYDDNIIQTNAFDVDVKLFAINELYAIKEFTFLLIKGLTNEVNIAIITM